MTVYVDSAATGANDGTTKVNAFVNLPVTLTAGEDYWLSHTHSEKPTTTKTYTCSSAAGNPCKIVSINFANDTPTKGAVIGNDANINLRGHQYIQGTRFKFYQNGSSGSGTWLDTSPGRLELDDVDIEFGGGSGSVLSIGIASGSGQSEFVARNTRFKYSAVGQSVNFERVRVEIDGGAIDATSSAIPTTNAFKLNDSGASGVARFREFDFSASGSGKTIFGPTQSPWEVYCINCKRDNAVTKNGAISDSGGGVFYWINSDGANTDYNEEIIRWEGTVTVDTGVYVTAGSPTGSVNGTTKFSIKMVGTNCSTFHPLRGGWLTIRNETVGAARTVGMNFLADAAADITNAQFYGEFETLQDATRPLGTHEHDRVAVFATPAGQTSGIAPASWTKGAASNTWRGQKAHITTAGSVQQKGLIRGRPCLGANITVYVNGRLEVT